MNPQQQPVATGFQWAPPVNVDGKFSAPDTGNALAGQYPEPFFRDVVSGIARYPFYRREWQDGGLVSPGTRTVRGVAVTKRASGYSPAFPYRPA